MTKETEYYLRQGYELWTRDGLLDHIIELQKKIEILEFHIATLDASNVLHNIAKEIEAETAAMIEEKDGE